jgi:hypothetical protein
MIIPKEAIDDICTQGSNDEAVNHWLSQPIIARQFALLSDDEAREIGASHGANDYQGDSDRDINLAYVLWQACWDIHDDDYSGIRDPKVDGWPDIVEDLQDDDSPHYFGHVSS